MGYENYTALFAVILRAIAEDRSVSHRMGEVIGECERQCPHGDWSRFRDIAYDADNDALAAWSTRTLGNAPDNAQGAWFGLINVVRDGGVFADMYAAFAPAFDPQSNAWAYGAVTGTDPELNSQVLAAIHELAYGHPDGLGDTAEYPLVIAYGAMAARRAMELGTGLAPSLQGAAVGYDSGDWLVLGHVNERQFVTAPEIGA